jgi:hypothetical protein
MLKKEDFRNAAEEDFSSEEEGFSSEEESPSAEEEGSSREMYEAEEQTEEIIKTAPSPDEKRIQHCLRWWVEIEGIISCRRRINPPNTNTSLPSSSPSQDAYQGPVIILNTVGGDVEAGLPSRSDSRHEEADDSLVLGGGPLDRRTARLRGKGLVYRALRHNDEPSGEDEWSRAGRAADALLF